MHQELTPRAVGLAGSIVAGLQGLRFRVSSMASIQSLLISGSWFESMAGHH
jgi:hypothetical protein